MSGTSLYRDLIDRAQSNNENTNTMAGLPNVDDPEATFAGITRQDYMDYVDNFRGFEERLLALTDDDSLVKQAREDQATQNKIAKEVQQRNLEGMEVADYQLLKGNNNKGPYKEEDSLAWLILLIMQE